MSEATALSILQYVLPLVLTGIMGWLAYFIKKTIDEMKEKNKEQDKKIEDVQKELSDLKADLPLIYVTREDYIRTMNNIDSKLDKMYDCLMKGGGQGGK